MAELFKDLIARRLEESRRELSGRWLARLSGLVPVDDRDIFPSETLLDHIPTLLNEIASFIAADGNDVGVSSVVTQKAQELGRLRYEQQASVHQIVREYDNLASVLEDFVIEEGDKRSTDFGLRDSVETMARLNQAVRALMQTTVDTFVAAYAATIEEQRQRLVDFNRTLSHELRGPMNTLRIVSTLMDEAEDPSLDQRRKLAGLVRSGVDRTLKILEDLEGLSGTRPADEESPGSQEIELSGVVVDATRQLEEMASAKGVEIRVQEGMPGIVVDVGKLEITLVNLVANAIKYADPEKPDRFVEISAEIEAGKVTIRVADNGLGIPAASQGQIFDRFYRAHPDMDAELGVDGSGLGLVIVQDCVSDIDGEIRFESREGEGTVFSVSIPHPNERETA